MNGKVNMYSISNMSGKSWFDDAFTGEHIQRYWAKEVQRMKKQNNSYSFHTTAPSQQVDFSEIYKDLSPSNPIAFVETDGEDYWMGCVIPHDSLTNKDIMLNGDDHYDLSDGKLFVHCDCAHDFARWKRHFSDVFQAPWPDKYRNKGITKVSFPAL